jgi:diguanylate cyclase (GGDEF)-like protein/PAS domain S-box-containing protein
VFRRNPLGLLVVLLVMVLALVVVSIVWTSWSYRVLPQLLPSLFTNRLQKITLSYDIIDNVKDMELAKQCWEGHARTECLDHYHQVAAKIERDLASLRQLVETPHGKELLLAFSNAHETWQMKDAGRSGDDIAGVLTRAAAFADYQQERMKDDMLQATSEVRDILWRISISVTAIGGLVLVAVAFCLSIVGRNLRTTNLVLTTTANSVLIANRRGRVVAFNPAFEKMSGLQSKDIIGRPLESIGYSGRWLAEALRTGEARHDLKVRWPRGNGDAQYLSLDLLPWHDKRGRIRGGMAVIRDITAQWQRTQELSSRVGQLQELAVRDSLTGLYNHRSFMEELTGLIDRSRAAQLPLALLMIDLDHFKLYNDALGHPMGDRLLEEYSRLLAACVRKNDLVGRYGGDEFVVALAGADNAIAAETAERIRDSVAYHPFPGREVLPGGRLTVSIGVSFFPGSAINCLDLVRRADAALYEAKRTSRNRVELYYSALDELRKTLRNENGTLITTVKSLLSVIDSQDRYTFHHSDLVVRYSTWIAKILGWDAESLQQLRVAALVHDIGKIHVSPRILSKTQPLSKLEWEQVRQHPVHGADILRPIPALAPNIIPAVLYHHERWDGSGYPYGLKGKDIPLMARVISVADSLEAMLSNRPHRTSLTAEAALAEIRLCAGTHFDPMIVEALLTAWSIESDQAA